MELRAYQQLAVNSVYDYLREHDNNPCVVLPTGTGKSLVIAQIAHDAVTKWHGRVLILAHVKELLVQNAEKLKAISPDLDIGVYSAGLGMRDSENAVIVAGIQSVYFKADELGVFNLIIIDEAHTVPPEGDGMYRTFIQDAKRINPNIRIIGLTATPYRLRGGAICAEENILNAICYEAGMKEMIHSGFLSPIFSRAGFAKADFQNLHIRGGEFIAKEVENVMSDKSITSSACSEIVRLTADRKSVLIFCASVAHCEQVADMIRNESGMECAVVTGDTAAADREEVLTRFRADGNTDLFEAVKPLKFVCNVNVLTTGFDAPNIDCVVLLRPTASPGLLVQMVGRGTRLSPGKKNCLILDYGENIIRHGQIDMIRIHEQKKSNGGGDAPAKECPQCHALIFAGYRSCPECQYAFPVTESNKLQRKASGEAILSGDVVEETRMVENVFYSKHQKRYTPDAPPTLKVEYEIGFNEYISEWVCPEHTGFAREKFVKWWQERARGNIPMPDTVDQAIAMALDGYIGTPSEITIRTVGGEKFPRIVKAVIPALPIIDLPTPEKASEIFSDIDDDDIPF